ncbi:MAG: cutinase family protein [Bifidobacteriaceae bacterium]|jgi:hypothetical protein|nr:cutinase family protein [Bifidobacteriaceae bacterium]
MTPRSFPRLKKLAAIFAALAAAAAFGWPSLEAEAAPAAYEAACKPVEAVWARGSGQPTLVSSGSENRPREFARFSEQLVDRLGTDVHVYELGSESIDGYQYPAPAIGTRDWEAVGTSVDAWLSGGKGATYGAAVIEGASELTLYVYYRAVQCPASVFVLGGYSQGAQVVGTAYIEGFADWMRERVVFQMLFGDPKLHLPEGEGGFLSWAPACSGRDYSPWRREVPDCHTDNGSLGARKPYLPASWDQDTGLWCADKDFVCGSSKWPGSFDGHRTYANEGSGIDQGVAEAVARIYDDGVLPKQPVGPPVPVSQPGGSTGLDVVFLVDSTGSMQDDIREARGVATALSGVVAVTNGRVGLAEYRDSGDVFTARVRSDLQQDLGEFTTELAAISVTGGGDEPEALLHALKHTMNTVSWRDGATKAVVMLTDASYHDPDRVDGTTLGEVAALSLAIDPVNVYPVVPSDKAGGYEELAAATSGQVVVNTGDAAAALEDALIRIQNRPVGLLALNAYYASPGGSVRFDGSGSYSPDSEVVKWDWDFDGDGVFDLVDGPAVVDHVYGEPFEGYVQLRVTDAAGLIGSVSVPVTIGSPPAEDPGQVAPVGLEAHGDGSDVTLTWDAAVAPGKAWLVTYSGVDIGLLGPAARSVVVGEVDRSLEAEFGVAPVSADTEVGPAAYVTLAVGGGKPSPQLPSIPAQRPGSVTPEAPSVGLSAVQVRPGGSVTVTGRGFVAGEAVDVELHSTPVALGSTVVGAGGGFSLAVSIPSDATLGQHLVAVRSGAVTVTAGLEVVKGPDSSPGSGRLPTTGAITWQLAGIAGLVAGAGIALVRGRRRFLAQRG